MGRHTTATPEAKADILARLSVGEPLADICRSDEMPAVRTVSAWKRDDAEFHADFARAREDGHDAIAARVRHTARGLLKDQGGESSGDVQRDKLIIETDLKLLAKWDKRYGDKLIVDSNSTVTHRYDLDRLEATRLDDLERILADASASPGGTSAPEPSALH